MSQAYQDPGLILPPNYVNLTTPAFSQSGQISGFLSSTDTRTTPVPDGISPFLLAFPFGNTGNFTIRTDGSFPLELVCNTPGLYNVVLNYAFKKTVTNGDTVNYPTLGHSLMVYNDQTQLQTCYSYSVSVAKNNSSALSYIVSYSTVISVNAGEYIRPVLVNNTGNTGSSVYIYNNSNDALSIASPPEVSLYLTFIEANITIPNRPF